MNFSKKIAVATLVATLFTAAPISTLTHDSVEAASRKKEVKQVAVPGLVELKKSKAQLYYKDGSKVTKKKPYVFWDYASKKTRRVTVLKVWCFNTVYNIVKIHGKKYWNLNHGIYIKASEVDFGGANAASYYHKNGTPYISKSALMQINLYKKSKKLDEVAAKTSLAYKVLKTVKIKGKTYYQVGKDKYLKKGDAVLLSDK